MTTLVSYVLYFELLTSLGADPSSATASHGLLAAWTYGVGAEGEVRRHGECNGLGLADISPT